MSVIEFIGSTRIQATESQSEAIQFEYHGGTGEVWVNITYQKCYPAEHYPDIEKGSIAEWDVTVNVSADLAVEKNTLMDQTMILNAAVLMHQQENHFLEVTK